MSDLVVNPEDRFSRVAAQMYPKYIYKLFAQIGPRFPSVPPVCRKILDYPSVIGLKAFYNEFRFAWKSIRAQQPMMIIL